MTVTCNLTQYLQFVEHLYRSAQGLLLSENLSLSDNHVHNMRLWHIDIAAGVSGKCIAPLDNIVISHLLCVKSLYRRSFVQAFMHQSTCVAEVVKLLQAQNGANWMLPVMYTVCTDLRLVAQKADTVSNSHGEILEKATVSLMNCYRLCVTDSEPPQELSKRVGLFGPVNHLLKLYFRTDKFNLCQSMIRAVEPAIRLISPTMAQLITFKFFVGRLAVLEADFRVANMHLTFAFRKCHPGCYKNKRLILVYLLPVKMLLGYMPTKAFVDRYDLPLFWDLLTAVKEGNLKTFETIVDENRRYFADAGLVIALENLRVITYRNIFKKVYLAQNSNKVPVSCFRAGLQMMSKDDVDTSETLCLIASLIYNKKMRAYLCYQRQIVIFSTETAPFPRLSTLWFHG